MNKIALLMLAATLTACGPSQPTETVDDLVRNPVRIKEIQRLCREDRAKVGDELCRRAAEAANRRFLGSPRFQCNNWRYANPALARGWCW